MTDEQLEQAFAPHLSKQRRSNLMLMVPGVLGLLFAGMAVVNSLDLTAYEPMMLPPGTCESGEPECIADYKQRFAENRAADARMTAALTGLGAAMLLLWGGIGWRRYRDFPSSAVGKALAEPQEIVWVYGLARSDGAAAAINLCKRNGKVIEAGVLPAQLGEVESLLASRLPHATHGHDAQREQAFRNDPSSLAR